MEFNVIWTELQKSFNLVENQGKICWENKVWTGQTLDTLSQGIKQINQSKIKWNQFTIRLKNFSLKENIENFNQEEMENPTSLFVVLDNKNKVIAKLKKIEKLGQGADGKVYSCRSLKDGNIYAIKSLKTKIQLAKDKIKECSNIVEKKDIENLEGKLKSYEEEAMYASNEFKIEREIINIVNPQGKLEGMIAPSKIFAPLIHGCEKIANKDLGISLMSCRVNYENDATNLYEKWSPERIFKGVLQVCRALEVCHKQKIFINDIKPPNIFYVDDKLHLGDLGRSYQLKDKLLFPAITRGYYNFWELNKVKNITNISQLAVKTAHLNIFSLGISIFEMVVGKRIDVEAVSKENIEGLKKEIIDEMSEKFKHPILNDTFADLIIGMIHPNLNQRLNAARCVYIIEKKILSLFKK